MEILSAIARMLLKIKSIGKLLNLNDISVGKRKSLHDTIFIIHYIEKNASNIKQ